MTFFPDIAFSSELFVSFLIDAMDCIPQVRAWIKETFRKSFTKPVTSDIGSHITGSYTVYFKMKH